MLHITQVSLSVQNFVFITEEGEAFKATIPKKKQRDGQTQQKGNNIHPNFDMQFYMLLC